MNRHLSPEISRCAAASLLLLISAAAACATDYHYGVVVETANAYSSCFGSGSNLSNSNQSGANFLSQLTSVNSLGFQLFAHWQDSQTWDTDFLDPDTAGANSNDDDTHNF
ncbi:MAG: hypothetical protein JO097_04940, partial [Acidobacteriaceae bacterium]|nr:hypothetical protein [Acidobacteriaceae bacterium]